MSGTNARKNYGRVLILYPDGSEVENIVEVDYMSKLEDSFCNVGLSAGMTINVGNFEFVKFDVSLSIPCPHGDIDEVSDFVEEWVSKKVEENRGAIKESYGK